MSRRQVVSVDDEDMIKAFLSRLDSRTHSQQNLSMPISPAPTVERPAAGAKAILPIATSETHHDAVLAQNADPLAHADTSTKEAVSASSAGTTPIGHGKDEDKWVDPRHRYDPKALRNHAPLLTHSASGALAAQRIQSIIDESTAEQPKPRDTEAVSSHRNRVPLPQIGKIAAQFQQWYSDPTSGTNAASSMVPTTQTADTTATFPKSLTVDPVTLIASAVAADDGATTDGMDWTPEYPAAPNFDTSPYSTPAPLALDIPKINCTPGFALAGSFKHHGNARMLGEEIQEEEGLEPFKRPKPSRREFALMRQEAIQKRIALNIAKMQSEFQMEVDVVPGVESLAQIEAQCKTEPRTLSNTMTSSKMTPAPLRASKISTVEAHQAFSQMAHKHGINVSTAEMLNMDSTSTTPVRFNVSDPITHSVGKDFSQASSSIALASNAFPIAVTHHSAISTPQVNTAKSPPSKTVDIEQQMYFGSWTKPEKRNTPPATVRSVKITNLPVGFTVSKIASLVFGGPVEQISFNSGNSHATVTFVHASDCMSYFIKTGNGIQLSDQQDHVLWVELGIEVDPMSGLTKSHEEGSCTRCLRAIGIEEDWTIAGLTKLASGKGGNARKVEDISVKMNRSTGIRTAEFRFCSISDAVMFRALLERDEDWEPVNVVFISDPCEVNPVPAGL